MCALGVLTASTDMSLSQSGIDALLSGGGAGTEPPPPAPPAQATSPPSSPASQEPRKLDLSRILGLYVQVSVMLADRQMTIESILKINVGTIIEFDVPFDSELTLEVNGHPTGFGQAVKVGENFGLRVSTVGSVNSRIAAMATNET